MIRRPPRSTLFPYTDALPISRLIEVRLLKRNRGHGGRLTNLRPSPQEDENCRESLKLVNLPDRKSTRLNSSHQIISYAVFCLKKKKKDDKHAHHVVDTTPLAT